MLKVDRGNMPSHKLLTDARRALPRVKFSGGSTIAEENARETLGEHHAALRRPEGAGPERERVGMVFDEVAQ